MQTIDVSSAYEPVPATFFQRFFAWLLDRIIVFFIQILIVFLFFGTSILSATVSDPESFGFQAFFSGFGLLTLLLLSLAWFLYRYFTEIQMNGQTLGKRLLGIRVVKENGLPATSRDILIRELVFVLFGMIPYISFFILLANAILVAFVGKKQALHDIIAKTMVVPAH
ncbi:MAG: RDD family protein [Brockia lithotrophica]|nr:RDD family protein [Brockia lithotrophica]